ncbi:type II toxin-antitoxin system RelE/ParE family toxin [Nanoarchaeota archaeon]
MVKVVFHPSFKRLVSKIKDASMKDKVKKQITKMMENPELGKPMKFARKGTREVYITPYRLSYIYYKKEDKLIFLDLYHKDEQ